MRPSFFLALLLLGVSLAFAHAAARGEEPTPKKRKAKLDLAFYQARIVPIVQGICAECHADPSRTLGRHRLKPPPGREVTARHVKQNFKTISKLIRPGKPHRSAWLLKPLGPHQGGLEHGGGQRIEKGSANHRAMLAFVRGERLAKRPEPPPDPPAPVAVVRHPLTAGASVTYAPGAFTLDGDATVVLGDDGASVLRPGAGGGGAALHLETDVERAWLLTLLVRGPGRGLGWRLDDRPWRALDEVTAGDHRVGSLRVFDGSGPILAPSGDLRVEDGHLTMRGTVQAPAAWLASETPLAVGLEARVRMPEKEQGGEDALLLFDMGSVGDGHFVGLLDAGRRFVAGRLEGGRLLVVAAARVAPREGATRAWRLSVRFTEDGALGILEDEAEVFVHAGRPLGGRRFGLFTRGRLTVEGLSARERADGTPAYEARFEALPVVRIPAGRHTIHLALPSTAPAIRSLRLEPLAGRATSKDD